MALIPSSRATRSLAIVDLFHAAGTLNPGGCMRKPARSVAVFHYVFLITGTATVLLGILLARGEGLSSGDVHSGAMMATQFGGQVVGALLVARRPTRSLILGLVIAIFASGALFWAAGPTTVWLFALGVGLGMVMSSTNVAAGQEAELCRRGSVLELLNVFWPVGAALCAPVVVWVGRITNPWHVYGIVAMLFVPALVWLGITRPAQISVSRVVTPAQSCDGQRSVSWTQLAVFSGAAALTVGIETGLATWLPTFATRSGFSARLLMETVAGFWCGSVLSRAAAAYLLRHMTLHRLAAGAAAVAVVCTTLLPICRSPALLGLVAVGSACGIAPLYPALLTKCVDLRGKGVVFMSAGLGSAFVPWLIGRASGGFGSLRIAMLVPAVGALILTIATMRASLFPRNPEAVEIQPAS
jgi:fucose permease